MEARPPFPPFTPETAPIKVRAAEDAWNTRDPARVALAYTQNCAWRHRTEFLQGREAIIDLLTHKWQSEHDYRLVKELWEFDEHGLMRKRYASIDLLPITQDQRLYHWPLGRRPDDHPGLSQLGL